MTETDSVALVQYPDGSGGSNPAEPDTSGGGPPASGGAAADQSLEFYKLEYEKGTQRYDDIFKAAWTNFSYMAVVAGAILTFGGDRFLPELSALLACLPLLFWWLASFEPLNKYGDQVIDRLGLIELILTDKLKAGELNEKERALIVKYGGLRHFRDFRSRKLDRPIKSINVLRWTAALLVFGASFILALREFGLWQYNYQRLVIGLIYAAGVLVWLLSEQSHFKKHERNDETPSLKWRHFARSRAMQFRRVRFIVRGFAALLVIIAVCLGARAYRLHVHEGKNLLTPKSSEVKATPVEFRNSLGVKIEGNNAAEPKKEDAAPSPANKMGQK